LRDYADIYRKLAKGSPTLSKPESMAHPPLDGNGQGKDGHATICLLYRRTPVS